MKILSFIFLIFSLVTCNSCKTEQDEKSEDFLNYIKSFGVCPADSCIYFLFPGNQCKNCFYFDAAKLQPGLNERLIIFSGFPDKRFKGFRNFYYDTTDRMLDLALIDYGSRILRLKNGKVKSVLPLRDFYRQMDSLALSLPNEDE